MASHSEAPIAGAFMASAAHDPGTALPGGVPAAGGGSRFAMLDGWRALSVLLVVAGHQLPIGPKRWGLNYDLAATGMVLFFILSGFLITRFLSSGADLRVFIIRRFFRIVPLAWVVMVPLLIWNDAPAHRWAAHLLFYANLMPEALVTGGGHLWSLCVEMHFYVAIALFVALAGRRMLVALPLVALGFTLLQAGYGRHADIVTWFRWDEILAGGVLALAYAGHYGPWPQRLLGRLNPLWMLPLVFLSAHPAAGPLNYLRAYLAMLTVGASLYGAPPLLVRVFENRVTAYVATISYAIYILHMPLAETWLGSGDRLVRYAKRPLLFAAILVLAHLSTFRFEQPCIAFAKRLTRGIGVRTPA